MVDIVDKGLRGRKQFRVRKAALVNATSPHFCVIFVEGSFRFADGLRRLKVVSEMRTPPCVNIFFICILLLWPCNGHTLFESDLCNGKQIACSLRNNGGGICSA